jgi:parvulin-like peptidyl-prolyl isomerase
MLRRLQLALLLFAVASAAAAETLDRIVVVVNKGVILASQWDEAIRFEALTSGRDVAGMTDAECDAALDRLIDQELLQQEIAGSNYQPVSPAEVDAKVAGLRHQLAPGADDAQWHSLLTRYGLTEQDVHDRVAAYVDILRFVDLRFRPSIHIDPRTVEAYYRTTLVPQAQAGGTRAPEFKQAAPQIEELLVQQRIDDSLNAYLKNLRAQSRIQRMAEKAPAKEAAAR